MKSNQKVVVVVGWGGKEQEKGNINFRLVTVRIKTN